MDIKLLNLQHLYGDGARSKFQDLAAALIQHEHEGARQTRDDPGDGGVDIFIGDWTSPDGIDVFQAKYFPNRLGESQKAQIRKSFMRCKRNTQFKLRTWTLRLPFDLSPREQIWFETWKKKHQDVAIQTPWTATKLENLLNLEKNRGLKEAYFHQAHLTQIRETHEAVAELTKRLVREPLVQKLVPRFLRAEAPRCFRFNTKMAAAIEVWFAFQNPGSEPVRAWGLNCSIDRVDRARFIILAEECDAFELAKRKVEADRTILGSQSGQDVARFGVYIDPNRDLSDQLREALGSTTVSITPVTESGPCEQTSFPLSHHVDFAQLATGVSAACAEQLKREAPKHVLFPEGQPYYLDNVRAMGFYAVADSRRIRCMITHHAFEQWFGRQEPYEAPMRATFSARREEIRALALSLILEGEANSKDELVINGDLIWRRIQHSQGPKYADRN